ncbi:alcohol dehydrogenase catalytic domain-containing protein [Streptomyces sp. NPDC017179]|uniref:alcohol dehydrogenase catalytic domain-containing protein n=1 Tax=Streptomyces sp. NPDC017179 TaxID=3364979 RepID=UPI0037B3BB70
MKAVLQERFVRGDPYAAWLMGGMGPSRPKCRVAGIDAAGVVEAAGAGVEGIRPGTPVLGFCTGAFAEYACTACVRSFRRRRAVRPMRTCSP